MASRANMSRPWRCFHREFDEDCRRGIVCGGGVVRRGRGHECSFELSVGIGFLMVGTVRQRGAGW